MPTGLTLADLGPAWLFCPADRPDRYAKAAAAADIAILDLEDAVSPDDKPAARSAVEAAADSLDSDRTVIRVNPAGSEDHRLDLEMLRRTPFRNVMLAKAESAADLAGLDDFSVTAICETARGVLAAPEIAAVPHVAALNWGPADLAASLGGGPLRLAGGGYRPVAEHARSSVLLAAAAFGKIAVDTVVLDFHDDEGLRAEASDAAVAGFAAKACIHPRQVALIRGAFAPTADEIAWARRVLEAAATERGVFAFEGQMVDEPVFRRARRTLDRG